MNAAVAQDSSSTGGAAPAGAVTPSFVTPISPSAPAQGVQPAAPAIPAIVSPQSETREAAEKVRAEEKAREALPQLDVAQRNEFQDFVAQSLGRVLPMFGYNLFTGVPTTFAPVDRIPVTPDYMVGPGDEVVIRAWGQLDVDYRTIVDRNGAINIPKVGTINIAGIKYQDLEAFIKNAISRNFRNFDLNVTLGQLRSVQIFVVGQARRPGSYTVSSLSTLVNALFASGGPSFKGSMRRIQLKRGNQIVTELDLYDLLLKGDKAKDARLLPGDVIYIPPIGELVAIAGSVNEPAIYEIKDKASLGELIDLSGGFTTTAASQKATVERIVDRKARAVDEFALDKAGLARQLRDGDLVRIFALSPKFENVVTLRGVVANPGRYPWRDGLRVSDIIPNKDSLITPDYWVRQNAAPRIDISGPQRLRVEVRRSIDEINWDYAVIERLNYNDLTPLLLPFNLGRAILEGDQSNNVPLRPGDIITIFSKADIVVPVAKQTTLIRLEGEVATPGIYQVMPGETLRQLVARIGGVTPNAYLYGAEFTREATRAFQQKRLDEAIDHLERAIQRQLVAGAAGAVSKEEVESSKVQAQGQQQLVARLRQIKATGRIVLDLPAAHVQLKDLPDLVLEDGDRFVVPPRPSTVSVIGAVYNQNAFIFRAGQRLSDYLTRAGGPTKDADTASLYVVKADGSVISRRQSNWLFDGFTGEQLNPGDTIIVPEQLEKFRLTKELKDWSQIFYQFALGVAGLKVLRDL